MKHLIGCVVVVALMATSPLAIAQNAKSTSGVLQLREIEIVGRVQKPIASVDVGKISMKLTLVDLRQPFLDRIEAAISHEPF